MGVNNQGIFRGGLVYCLTPLRFTGLFLQVPVFV